ncbi:hypothetical protein QAD02_016969 [Eretmocerus hayati]|uniref:Uncharacterized protein n=1 Tax=Eretmocerus hayati TaxID=131215 RepID=A0ACC2PCL7_9HYME|nr:hypothetical protein QAD02_016969 [Eretmocerus hayati]
MKILRYDRESLTLKNPEAFSSNSENWAQLKTNHRQYIQLKQALNERKIEIMESLLQEGCPVNVHPQGCDGRTPLHYSIYLGHTGIVKKLLQRGASVNVKNLNNETALILAAKFEKMR